MTELGKVHRHQQRGCVVVGYQALGAESCLGMSKYWVKSEIGMAELNIEKAKGCDLARAGP